MTSALEQSFKKRLQLIAKERRLTPSEVWHNVITERFLIRLSHSPYRDHFIFKGGTLLARHINIGRETRDLDFSIHHFNNEIAGLQKAFEEIVQMQSDDGFIFINPIVSRFNHFHMRYPGANVRIEVRFGKSKFLLLIDLGYGDLVYPQEKEIRLLSNVNGPLFEATLTMSCYPPEFIYAEKLETVIYRGSENSRMKDYHDLYSLTTAKILNQEEAMEAIRIVFDHRKTSLSLPIQFKESELSLIQGYWKRYLQTVKMQLPTKIVDVIETINSFIYQSSAIGTGS